MGTENLIKAQKQTGTFWTDAQNFWNWLLISLPNGKFSVHKIDFSGKLEKQKN